MIIDLIYITALVCFIVDISGFVDTLKQFIFKCALGKAVKYKDFSFKPFDCSLCATWWACIIYLIICGELSLFLIFVSGMLSLFSGVISQFLMLIRDLITSFIDKIYNKI